MPDGTPAPVIVDPVRVSPVTTRPGAHVPHAYLTREDGQKVAIIDIAGPDEFLLIAGAAGDDWITAAHEASALTGAKVRAVRVGHDTGDYFDERLAWLRRREVGEGGAVLVRPDNVVAWRATEAPANPGAALEAALRQILGK